MSDDPYLYPSTDTLINIPGLRDRAELDRYERLFTLQRLAEPLPQLRRQRNCLVPHKGAEL